MRAYKKPVGSATRLERCLRHPRVSASPATRIDGLTRTQAAEPTGLMVNIELSSDGFLRPAGISASAVILRQTHSTSQAIMYDLQHGVTRDNHAVLHDLGAYWRISRKPVWCAFKLKYFL